jgi:3-(3-hydroxy-phenyl)propionate hydroxylase
VIVGAGPVGLAAAIDLAQQGIDFIIVDDNNTVSVGSRAICYAKRALEILDRLGCGEPICARGVSWRVGKVYFHDELAYQFDLLPEAGHKRPAFVNLQQYHFEEALVDRLAALGHRVRWRNKAVGIEQDAAGVRLDVETPDGRYTIAADFVIAADGARSPVRDMLGLEWKGQVFRDRFLIADVHMKAEFPTERWFWFDPPFPGNPRCCTGRRMTCGASISSSAGTPIRRKRRSPSGSSRASRRCWAMNDRSSSSGSASTRSSAGVSIASYMAV